MDPALASVASPASPAFADGFGARHHVVDRARHEPVEMLCLRGELTAIPSFEFALRERVAHLAAFRHACYAQVRSVERLKDSASTLALVSDITAGVRLSTIFTFAEREEVTLDIEAALCLLRQLVPAIAMLHENEPDIAHGAIAAERLIVTPGARVMVVEHVMASALEQLRFSHERYWKELRVALPRGTGAAQFDHRTDVTQLGIVALELILGRRLHDDEGPSRLGDLVSSAWAVSARGGLEPLPAGLRAWLTCALQLDTRNSFDSAVDAQAELERVLGESDYLAAPASLESFLAEYRAACEPPVTAPAVEPRSHMAEARPQMTEARSPMPEPLPQTPAPREHMLTPREPMLTPREPMLPPREPMLTPREPMLTPREPMLTPREPMLTPRESMLTPREPMLTPRESMLTPREPMLTPRESMLTPRESMLTPREPMLSSREPKQSLHESMLTHESTLTAREAIVTPREPMLTPREPMPVWRPAVAEPEPISVVSPVTQVHPVSPVSHASVVSPVSHVSPVSPVSSAKAVSPSSSSSVVSVVSHVPTPTPVAASRPPMPPPSSSSHTVRKEPLFSAADIESPSFEDEVELPKEPRKKWQLAAAAIVLIALAGAGVTAARRYVGGPGATVTDGTLVMTTNPPGARLYVDGVERGATPLTVTLKAGAHALELRGDGEPRLMPITMTAGAQVSQYIELPKTMSTAGQLQIRTEPAGARVSVDGIARGASPITVPDLSPGEHAVVLESDLGAVKQTVTIEAGVTASLTVPLAAPEGAPVSGWMAITAPSDVQVFENKRLLGTSQSDRLMVSAGRHEIEIVNETLGYRATRTVQVAPGKVTPVKVDFPKGTIALNALPWAEVWVDGEKVGDTPIGSLSLTIGSHEFVFRHPDLGEQRHAATITVSTPARLSVDLRKK